MMFNDLNIANSLDVSLENLPRYVEVSIINTL
jgi:hypothetical protein